MPSSYEVRLNGQAVGQLVLNGRGRWEMRFSDAYRKLDQRPVLGQAFEDDLEHGVEASRTGRLPAFFANLIPEAGPLRELLERTFQLTPGDDLALLEAVGLDLPGAVSVHRTSEDALSMAATGSPVDPEPTAVAATGGLRFSLAGVQLKFSAVRKGRGLTLPASGTLGDWIVKLPSPDYSDLIQNEYAMMTWARLAGFDVPECELVPSEAIGGLPEEMRIAGHQVYVIRRFDRLDGRRIHQEDFAQVTGRYPDDKYVLSFDQVGAVIRLTIGEPAFDEFVRRIVLMLAMGNSDAHLKNWALLYRDARTPALAPLYDLVCTAAYPNIDGGLALSLSSVRSPKEVDDRRLVHLAKKAGAEPERVLAVAADVVGTLSRLRKDAKLLELMPESVARAIPKIWEEVPLLRAHV